MASAVRLVCLDGSPPTASDSAKVETEIREGNDHQKTLKNEIRESFSDAFEVRISHRRPSGAR